MGRLLLTLCFLAAVDARAQHPHLLPEASALAVHDTPYAAYLSEVFNPAGHNSDIVARMVLLPTCGQEWLAGVRRTGSGYEAYSVLPDSSLCEAGYVYSPDGNSAWWEAEGARAVNLQRQAAPLDDAVAEQLGAVWELAILAAHYPPEDDVVVVGGTNAHFSRWVRGRGTIAGRAKHPPPGSAAEALMRLGEAVGRFARGEGVTAEELAATAGRLSALLVSE